MVVRESESFVSWIPSGIRQKYTCSGPCLKNFGVAPRLDIGEGSTQPRRNISRSDAHEKHAEIERILRPPRRLRQKLGHARLGTRSSCALAI